MATIQYNGRIPSDYSLLGTSDYDDRWDDDSGRTEVVTAALVRNSGNAAGKAMLALIDTATGILAETAWIEVPAAGGLDPYMQEPGQANLELTYRVENDNRMEMAAYVFMWDAEAGVAVPLRYRTFSVNSYAEPKRKTNWEVYKETLAAAGLEEGQVGFGDFQANPEAAIANALALELELQLYEETLVTYGLERKYMSVEDFQANPEAAIANALADQASDDTAVIVAETDVEITATTDGEAAADPVEAVVEAAADPVEVTRSVYEQSIFDHYGVHMVLGGSTADEIRSNYADAVAIMATSGVGTVESVIPVPKAAPLPALEPLSPDISDYFLIAGIEAPEVRQRREELLRREEIRVSEKSEKAVQTGTYFKPVTGDIAEIIGQIYTADTPTGDIAEIIGQIYTSVEESVADVETFAGFYDPVAEFESPVRDVQEDLDFQQFMEEGWSQGEVTAPDTLDDYRDPYVEFTGAAQPPPPPAPVETFYYDYSGDEEFVEEEPDTRYRNWGYI